VDDFFSLTPDRILDAVEGSMGNLGHPVTGVRATGRTWVLNSVENRVYEIEFEDSSRFVTKFYRPGRWKKEQILEEHSFLETLNKAEVPVVCPIGLCPSPYAELVGPTLGLSKEGIFFSVFPKIMGRSVDELDDEQIRHLGRFIGRLHNVGASFKARHRIALNLKSYGFEALEFLCKSPFLDDIIKPRYQDCVSNFLKEIAPLFDRLSTFAIHGDCHLANILWWEGKPLFVDFDDMVIGPAVQDIWMMLNGRDESDVRKRDMLIEAYEVFRPFDRNQLKLIEPLRGLRMIHYAAWIARRWNDPSFPRMFSHYGSNAYWFDEIQAIEEIRSLI
jgi:Ser/Thr protein kinase RdoA (MazF antagonist)